MLEQRLGEINARIADAAQRSGRDANDITLVAVSKYVDSELIHEAVKLGQRVFGENYVQEGLRKKKEFAESVEFHLIGNLQRNKVKKAIGVFDLIHTVDRVEVVDELSKVARSRALKQRCLLQVNISKEVSKSGVDEEHLPKLLEHALTQESLSIEGLMCIGTWGAEEDIRAREFEKLRTLRDDCESSFGVSLPELSMGMSEDYEKAIEQGATLVRVGSALFGPRE